MTEPFTGSRPSRVVEVASGAIGASTREQSRVWQPVLVGAERDAALAMVAETADVLTRVPHEDPSLAGGSAGRALLHARLAPGDADQRDAALACLRHALPSLRRRGGSASLHVGAAGIGWVLTHLSGTLLDDRDRCTDLDRALSRLLDRQPWPGHVDLVRGLVGIGVYALERLDGLEGPALLERVVAQLAQVSVREPDGAYWWTPPERLPEQVRQRSPQGHVDLGVAHGVPGVIAVLGAACAVDVATDTARPLLEAAIRWFLGEGLRGEVLPSWSELGKEPEPARTAWCYGEPGVASALLLAARAAGEPGWEDAALRLARLAATRPVEDSRVTDAGLCHGATGLGLVFARLHQVTGEQELHDAARFWFGHALDLCESGDGIAGYTAAGVAGADADSSLLTGATGIALALHAAATDVAPTWDRVLLLSTVPPTRPVAASDQLDETTGAAGTAGTRV